MTARVHPIVQAARQLYNAYLYGALPSSRILGRIISILASWSRQGEECFPDLYEFRVYERDPWPGVGPWQAKLIEGVPYLLALVDRDGALSRLSNLIYSTPNRMCVRVAVRTITVSSKYKIRYKVR